MFDKEIAKMLVVLTLISTTTGLLLGYVHKLTEDPIKQAEFKFAKEPALLKILPEFDNDLVKDSFTIKDEDDKEITVYPAKKDGKLQAVGFESTGAGGYGGDIRIMVGIDIEKKELRGIGIVAHAESPGLGARIEEDWFKEQFSEGFSIDSAVSLANAGGEIDAISGATLSSTAVCKAVNNAFELFKAKESDIVK